MHKVAAIELGRYLNRQVEAPKRGLRQLPVWHRRGKVAAKSDEHFGLASKHCLQGRHDIVPAGTRWLEPEPRLEPVEKLGGGPLCDAYRTIPLHVGVPPHGAKPGTLLSDVAPQQGQICQLLDIPGTVA